MAIKSYEEKHGAFHKAANDEPVFVIRSTDILGPDLVRLWATHAKAIGVDAAKVEEAMATARAMESYECKKKIPD